MAKEEGKVEGREAAGVETELGSKPQAVMDVWTVDDKYRARIGVAFLNEDGSLNVLLNALPVNRKLRISSRTNGNQEKS